MTPGGIALARQRAERGERTLVVDETGEPTFAVTPPEDLDRLRADDERRRAAVARIYEIAENFPEDEPEDAAMAAALEYREEMRARADAERE